MRGRRIDVMNGLSDGETSEFHQLIERETSLLGHQFLIHVLSFLLSEVLDATASITATSAGTTAAAAVAVIGSHGMCDGDEGAQS